MTTSGDSAANGRPARLPDATHVGAVRLQIASLERSLTYYRDFLGFRVISRGAGHATLGGGDERPLLELRERAGATPVPRRGRLGLFHFAILLPDRPSLGRFVRHLAATGAPAGSSDHLVSEAIYLQDPDGNGVELCCDRPRDQWPKEMFTAPLDVRALLAEAA